MMGMMPLSLEFSYNNLVTKTDHFIQKKIVLHGEHLPTDRMKTAQPNIHLFSNRRVKKPVAIGSLQLREIGRVTMFLAKGMRDFMLVEEVPDVDTHPH
jgi:hypothetical protein